jgi:hypothetical protein
MLLTLVIAMRAANALNLRGELRNCYFRVSSGQSGVPRAHACDLPYSP